MSCFAVIGRNTVTWRWALSYVHRFTVTRGDIIMSPGWHYNVIPGDVTWRSLNAEIRYILRCFAVLVIQTNVWKRWQSYYYCFYQRNAFLSSTAVMFVISILYQLYSLGFTLSFLSLSTIALFLCARSDCRYDNLPVLRRLAQQRATLWRHAGDTVRRRR